MTRLCRRSSPAFSWLARCMWVQAAAQATPQIEIEKRERENESLAAAGRIIKCKSDRLLLHDETRPGRSSITLGARPAGGKLHPAFPNSRSGAIWQAYGNRALLSDILRGLPDTRCNIDLFACQAPRCVAQQVRQVLKQLQASPPRISASLLFRFVSISLGMYANAACGSWGGGPAPVPWRQMAWRCRTRRHAKADATEQLESPKHADRPA